MVIAHLGPGGCSLPRGTVAHSLLNWRGQQTPNPKKDSENLEVNLFLHVSFSFLFRDNEDKNLSSLHTTILFAD